MTFWKKILVATQTYYETIHSFDSFTFLELTTKVFNECITNFSYNHSTNETIKPFRGQSRDYFTIGLRLLSAPDLNLDDQVRIAIGTLLAAKHDNDSFYEDDAYYKTNQRHLTNELKDAIHQLIEPQKLEKPYPCIFRFTAEFDNYFKNRINLIASAVFNKNIMLDDSIYITSSLISSKDAFNNKVSEMLELFDIRLMNQNSKHSFK